MIETDVVIVGVGSVGSMASWQLATRGLRVIGIDRFTIPGPFSAYAGESRVFRMVYAEGGHYTPLLQRARDLWRELEAACGAALLEITGVVTITDHDHPDHAALLRAGRERGLRFEAVTGQEARWRLPQHLIRESDVALFDPEGGYVRSERAVFLAVQLARRRGASFLGNRKVTALERHGDGWLVRTDQDEVRAPRVLIATGTGAGPVCVPGMDGVVVAAGFSGHGFKMATSLGAVAADLIAEGMTTTDISFMDPARFLGHTAASRLFRWPVPHPDRSCCDQRLFLRAR